MEVVRVDVIFLDFSKAFDCISHPLLLFKLQHHYGLTGPLLNWFSDYLCGCKQRVLIEGKASEWDDVKSGVPQGSILGPFLFLLFINDLPSSVHFSDVALFADDCKLFREILSVRDCELLQDDLDALHEWSRKWNMSFNPLKCKVLSISRSHNHINYDYNVDGTVLESVGDFKDIGVVFNKNLTFTDHIECIVTKAKRVCHMLKRSVGYRASRNVKLKLYQALVRPHVEYSSPHVHGHLQTNMTFCA